MGNEMVWRAAEELFGRRARWNDEHERNVEEEGNRSWSVVRKNVNDFEDVQQSVDIR